MTFEKPDFKKANIKANEILVASSTIIKFPCEAKKIVGEWTDIKCTTYEKAQKYGLDMKAFGSDSAVILNFGGRHIIFYNQNEIAERIRFSILHELGHYYMGHNIKKKMEGKYGKEEVEANCFAAQVLMPEQVIRELQRRGISTSSQFLVDTFKVSEEAAQKRLDTLNKYKQEWKDADESIFDETILFKYQDFMNKIIPLQNDTTWFNDEYERQNEREKWY